MQNLLGLKGIFGSLWEWHSDDYLPYLATNSANGSSNLEYKTISGGSWLNTLAISDGTRDLWASEFGSSTMRYQPNTKQLECNCRSICANTQPLHRLSLISSTTNENANNPN